MNVKEILHADLESIEVGGKLVPVFLQGTIDYTDAFPETFITFFTDDTDDRSFYDDETKSVDWSFSVILYSSDPSVVNEAPDTIIDALEYDGFKPQGKGRDIPSGVPTHTGWAMDFIYTEYLNN